MTRYACGNEKKVCQLTKHIFGLKHFFKFLWQLMMKIDLAPRINGKPLLNSSYKEEKLTT
jgi:hypothetical protein